MTPLLVKAIKNEIIGVGHPQHVFKGDWEGLLSQASFSGPDLEANKAWAEVISLSHLMDQLKYQYVWGYEKANENLPFARILGPHAECCLNCGRLFWHFLGGLRLSRTTAELL